MMFWDCGEVRICQRRSALQSNGVRICVIVVRSVVRMSMATITIGALFTEGNIEAIIMAELIYDLLITNA